MKVPSRDNAMTRLSQDLYSFAQLRASVTLLKEYGGICSNLSVLGDAKDYSPATDYILTDRIDFAYYWLELLEVESTDWISEDHKLNSSEI